MEKWEKRFRDSIGTHSKAELSTLVDMYFKEANTIGQKSRKFCSATLRQRNILKRKAKICIDRRALK